MQINNKYTQMRNIKQDYYDDMPGPFVYNEEELLSEIKLDKIHFNKPEYKQRFQIVCCSIEMCV